MSLPVPVHVRPRRSRWLLLALALLTFGCERHQGVSIGMLPKLAGIPYFNACQAGAEEAARELGVTLEYKGPPTADAVQQEALVNSWILRGFSAVAVAPNNPEAISPVLIKARERGLKVVTWDTDSAPGARQLFCNQVDFDALARMLVDFIAEEMGGPGRVALVSGTETAANQNTWMALMRKYAAAKQPGVTFIDPVEYPGEDEARAYQATQGLLKRPDPPRGIIGMTTVSAPAVAKAVSDAGLSGKVAVTGLSLPSAMRVYLKSGTVRKFILWNPADLGYLAVHATKRLIDGAVGDEIPAGRLGRLKVVDGQVVLGPPLVFDASNIDKYSF